VKPMTSQHVERFLIMLGPSCSPSASKKSTDYSPYETRKRPSGHIGIIA
jgi:hypothetical protein